MITGKNNNTSRKHNCMTRFGFMLLTTIMISSLFRFRPSSAFVVNHHRCRHVLTSPNNRFILHRRSISDAVHNNSLLFLKRRQQQCTWPATATAVSFMQPKIGWEYSSIRHHRHQHQQSTTALFLSTKTSPKSTTTKQKAFSVKDPYYLVIVESPSKCQTIENILNQYVKDQNLSFQYKVTSCMGHIRNLPKQKDKQQKQKQQHESEFPYEIAGIDLASGQYTPTYTILPGKESLVYDLQRQISQQNCIGVLLATDPDREGEAMAWHLADELNLLNSSTESDFYKRIRFTEITPDAIVQAVQATTPKTKTTKDDIQNNLKIDYDDDAKNNNNNDNNDYLMTSINYNLVQAQETRRILDRLAGYTVSPVLWKKIAPGLSAGRVQSVGMALVVQRERERLLFQSTQYYSVRAQFFGMDNERNNIMAKLQAVNGTAVANTGKDFTSTSQQLRPESSHKLHLRTEQDVMDVIVAMQDNPHVTWRIHQVKSQKRTSRSPVPYKTSTLQQEASRALGMPVQQVMRTAQQLYEQGLISYMRTDSTTLSQTATSAVKTAVANNYGSDFLGSPSSQRKTTKADTKFAQEAHEAIRPAVQPSGNFFRPNEISFTNNAAAKLYQMIYQRTLASGMKSMISNQTSVVIQGTDEENGTTFQFRTSGSVVVDPGYTVAYGQSKWTSGNQEEDDEEEDNDDENNNASSRQQLPPLYEGQILQLASITPTQHETQPPPRYTEASLVQELEALGVGRPSTYAGIVQILRDRAYVGSPATSSNKNRGAAASTVKGPAISARRAAGGDDFAGGGRGPLVPSLSAFVVCSLLEKYCPTYVDPTFTAQMEDRLDQIASGALHDYDNNAEGVDPRVAYLNEFYAGENGLAAKIKRIEDTVDADEARRASLPALAHQASNGSRNLDDADIEESMNDEEIGIFIGPWGPYVQKIPKGETDESSGTKPVSAPLPAGLASDLSTITPSVLKALLNTKEGGGAIIGTHPDDGRNIRLKTGRFGAYLQWGDDDEEDTSTHSLPKSKSSLQQLEFKVVDIDEGANEDNPVASDSSLSSLLGITLEEAIGYCSLPRTVSTLHEMPITAAIGPYGPYLKYNNTYISLNSDDGDVLTIEGETAEKLVTEGIINGKRKSARGVLAEIGEMEGSMITVKQGRFGSYINWKKINAKLPPDYAEDPSTLPLEEAWSLIEEKAASAGTTKGRKSKGSSKSSDSDLPLPPKRPLSAYMHFCGAKRPEVAKTEKSLGQVSKKLSQLWSEISVEERKEYDAMAAASKIEYEVNKREWKDECKKLTGHKPGSKSKRSSKSRSSSSARALSDPPPRRPKSAYLFFCDAKRPDVSTRIKSLGDVSKEIARLWSETTDRSEYEELAAADKLRYVREMEEYEAKGGIAPSTSKRKRKITVIKSSKSKDSPRAPSAYILFCREHRPLMVDDNGEKLPLGEATKRLAAKWRECSDETRLQYEEKAAKEKSKLVSA